MPGKNTRGRRKPSASGSASRLSGPPAASAAAGRPPRSPLSSPRSAARRCSRACRSWCRSGSAGRAANRPAPGRGGRNRARRGRRVADCPRRRRSTDISPATTARGPTGRWPASAIPAAGGWARRARTARCRWPAAADARRRRRPHGPPARPESASESPARPARGSIGRRSKSSCGGRPTTVNGQIASAPVIDVLDPHHGEIVGQAVIAQVIAERALRASAAAGRCSR